MKCFFFSYFDFLLFNEELDIKNNTKCTNINLNLSLICPFTLIWMWGLQPLHPAVSHVQNSTQVCVFASGVCAQGLAIRSRTSEKITKLCTLSPVVHAHNVQGTRTYLASANENLPSFPNFWNSISQYQT